MDENYKVNADIREAIILQTEIGTLEDLNLDSAVAIVDYVSNQMKQVADYDLTFSEVQNKVSKLIKKHKQMPFLLALKQEKLAVAERCILLYYMGQYRMGETSECFKSLVIQMYGETSEAADLIQNMMAGEHCLIRTGFLTSTRSRHHRGFEFELAGKSKKMMRIHQILPDFKSSICADTFELLYTVNRLFDEKHDGRITASELVGLIDRLLKDNEDLKFVEELKKLQLIDVEHMAIYLQALYDGANDNDVCIESVIDAVFENKHNAAKVKNEIFLKSDELIRKE